jgi:hypothetical protein
VIDVARTPGPDEPQTWVEWLELVRADLAGEGRNELSIRVELGRQLADLRRRRLAAEHAEHAELDVLLDQVGALARAARAYGNRDALELAAEVLERVSGIPDIQVAA